jgi:hypothetical protein
VRVDFELKDFLEAVGPTASLIFASWIFLSFLQSRYTAAYDRYRMLLDEHRSHGQRGGPRQSSISRQIRLYKQRCEQMRIATNVGVVAAILLIVTILAGGAQVILPDVGMLRFVGAGSTVLGLLLLIVAAGFVLRENTLIQHAIDDETSDVPEVFGPEREPAGGVAQRRPA